MAEVARLDWIAKLGFFARAIVYILLGYIALNIGSRAGEGQNAVFDLLRAMPGGRAVLIITAAGLVAYGIFRLSSAFLDLDGKGADFKGLAARAGQLISAIAHALLGYTAYTYISRLKQASGGDEKTQEAAQTILSLPMGSLLLGLIGLYMIVNAGSQALSAVNASFMKQIDPDAPQVTRLLGRIGYAARAALFAVIGWSLIQAAWFESQERARALGGALEKLRGNEALYTAVAAGLLTFGLFSLVLARYRIVPRIDVAGTVKRAARGSTAGIGSRR